MNRWARALTHDDIDALVEAYGTAPGSMVGFAFLMMNPVSNFTKYTIDLIDVMGDEAKLLNFLRMERWIADRPDHPGEVLRQWFKDLYQDNKLIRNELVLGERTVDLRNITMPVLNIYATGDTIIPVSCSKGVGGPFRHEGLHRDCRTRRAHRHVRRQQGAEDPRALAGRVVQGAQRITGRLGPNRVIARSRRPDPRSSPAGPRGRRARVATARPGSSG